MGGTHVCMGYNLRWVSLENVMKEGSNASDAPCSGGAAMRVSLKRWSENNESKLSLPLPKAAKKRHARCLSISFPMSLPILVCKLSSVFLISLVKAWPKAESFMIVESLCFRPSLSNWRSCPLAHHFDFLLVTRQIILDVLGRMCLTANGIVTNEGGNPLLRLWRRSWRNRQRVSLGFGLTPSIRLQSWLHRNVQRELLSACASPRSYHSFLMRIWSTPNEWTENASANSPGGILAATQAAWASSPCGSESAVRMTKWIVDLMPENSATCSMKPRPSSPEM